MNTRFSPRLNQMLFDASLRGIMGVGPPVMFARQADEFQAVQPLDEDAFESLLVSISSE